MSYEINDKTLIEEICGTLQNTIRAQEKSLREEYGKAGDSIPENFIHPLDYEIVSCAKELLSGDETAISYSKAPKLDALWGKLLNKAIICLRTLDRREPFLKNPKKAVVAYGIDKLEEYHKRYTEFESLMYGASAYYRDHVFHAIRVWMLGVFCLLEPMGNDRSMFISKIRLDGGAESPKEINFFEYLSMWTIVALCHDLGYPLEKAEQILDRTRKMMKEFVPNPNIWNNFGYNGTQDNINEYVLKFISTKMKASGKDEKTYFGRIQPKYYLKYAKSLENFQHGIISTVIIYKMLLYFLESDFNLNDDYVYKEEDARQFYIRREILRAIASHTCPDAYNIHVTTFPSLLFLCDELQEWGRKTWDELYTGIDENSVKLSIEKFSCDEIEIAETIDLKKAEDSQIIVQNIIRVFERQYSLYKTTFRDGQYTATRDFELKKRMTFDLPNTGAMTNRIEVEYCLPKQEKSYFNIDLSKIKKDERAIYIKEIEDEKSKKLYGGDINVKS